MLRGVGIREQGLSLPPANKTYKAAGMGNPHLANALAIRPMASGSVTDRATEVSRISMLRERSSISFPGMTRACSSESSRAL